MFTLPGRGRMQRSVGLLVEQRYLEQPQPAGLRSALEARGVDVRVIVAETVAADLGSFAAAVDDLALVVPRGRSTSLLALLRSFEYAGVPTLHGSAEIGSVVDKAGMAAALASQQIPAPRTWLGDPFRLAERTDLPFPLVLKPMAGDNARGLRVVRSSRELAATRWDEPVALAQEFHRGDAHDLKLYVAGDAVWAVRRPSPIHDDGEARSLADPGREVPVTAALRETARRCADLFGLVFFGVDCVMVPGGHLVIEVNDFPNYRGVTEGADEALATEVMTRLARSGEGSQLVGVR